MEFYRKHDAVQSGILQTFLKSCFILGISIHFFRNLHGSDALGDRVSVLFLNLKNGVTNTECTTIPTLC